MVECIRLGSDYGGYWIPYLPYRGVMYDCGVGEDATFAIEATRAFDLYTYLFDPTPRAKKYFNSLHDYSFIEFKQIGIAGSNKTFEFYPPRDPSHVSYSKENIQQTSDPITFKCYTIKTIMDILGDDELEILKLDIEGTEYEVLESLAIDKVFPKVIIMEAHTVPYDFPVQPDPPNIPYLHNNYTLVFKEKNNFTFLRNDLMEK